VGLEVVVFGKTKTARPVAVRLDTYIWRDSGLPQGVFWVGHRTFDTSRSRGHVMPPWIGVADKQDIKGSLVYTVSLNVKLR
jgi:hypothetical protein